MMSVCFVCGEGAILLEQAAIDEQHIGAAIGDKYAVHGSVCVCIT